MSQGKRAGHTMVSFSDLINGPKMFRETFGPKWGPRYWRAFFVIAVAALATVGLSQIGGFGKSLYSEVREWFSPASSRPQLPSTVLPQPGNCIISGGENRGKIEQNCK
jgi:hypothetical protein